MDGSWEIILFSELNSKKVFQDVQPIGGVGWSPSGNPVNKNVFHKRVTLVKIYILLSQTHTVDWSKLETVLYTFFVLSCPTKLTGLYRTVSDFAPCSSKFTLLIWTKMACPLVALDEAHPLTVELKIYFINSNPFLGYG